MFRSPILLLPILFLSGLYAQPESLKLCRHPVSYYTDYKVLDVGADTSLQIFERDTLWLEVDQFGHDPKFSFVCDDSLFSFHFKTAMVKSIGRAYFRDEDGHLYHKDDSIISFKISSIYGWYKVNEDQTVTINPTSMHWSWEQKQEPLSNGLSFRYQMNLTDKGIIMIRIR